LTDYPITIEGATATLGSAEELVVALDVLHGHNDREVLAQLQPHLPALVTGPRQLLALVRVLEPEEQQFLVEVMGPHLAGAIQHARGLRDLFATLADPRVEATVLDTLCGESLRRLIETPAQLAEVLQWIYGDCDRRALDLLGAAFLRGLLEDGDELGQVLHALEAESQLRLLDLLGWEHVLGVLHDERDLAMLMRALPAELSARLLDQLPPRRLRQLVPDDRHWRVVAPFLEADEITVLRGKLEAADAE